MLSLKLYTKYYIKLVLPLSFPMVFSPLAAFFLLELASEVPDIFYLSSALVQSNVAREIILQIFTLSDFLASLDSTTSDVFSYLYNR